MEERLKTQLTKRRQEGTIRKFLSPDQQFTNEQRHAIDFSSNDYLGLAHCPDQASRVEKSYNNKTHDQFEERYSNEKQQTNSTTPTPNSHDTAKKFKLLGATGSRLLSGDSYYCQALERWLTKVHNRESALIMNSGYDANLSVMSSLPQSNDIVIVDELVHNSILMGLRMSRITQQQIRKFSHNNMKDLESLLHHEVNITKNKKQTSKEDISSSSQILIVVESVYSMDGDVAPLVDICNLATKYNAHVIVDEAHGLGVYGRTNVEHLQLPEERQDKQDGKEYDDDNALKTPPLLSFSTKKYHKSVVTDKISSGGAVWGGTGVLAAFELESHPALLCSVHTFGKAAGCHGAVVCGSALLMEYLINYARPFIYSTALPPHSLVTIEEAYKTMISPATTTSGGSCGDAIRTHVFQLVSVFRCQMLKALDEAASAAATKNGIMLWPSPSPIQALVVPGNDVCIAYCRRIQQKSSGSILLYPIRTPTVPKGQERVRIILHGHNTKEQVEYLVYILLDTLVEMDLITLPLWEKQQQQQHDKMIRIRSNL